MIYCTDVKEERGEAYSESETLTSAFLWASSQSWSENITLLVDYSLVATLIGSMNLGKQTLKIK